jgi:hypothetical protein
MKIARRSIHQCDLSQTIAEFDEESCVVGITMRIAPSNLIIALLTPPP